MPYRALVTLTVLALGVCAVALFLPPGEAAKESRRPCPQPAPAAWEYRAWADSKCDRCGKTITADPQDGLYLIGGKSYWVHGRCARAIAKAAGR